MAKKQTAEQTPEASDTVDAWRTFDITDSDSTPGDGDLCAVNVFDTKVGRKRNGGRAIFDAARGVFFREPTRDDNGLVVSCAVGPRRDNYKAERLRDVVEFVVIEEAHDKPAHIDSVIDHRKALEHAETRPRMHAVNVDDD